MHVLLALDTSPFSDAAVQTIIDCFRPRDTVVRVFHVIDWCYELSACATYSEGPAAGRAIVLLEDELRRRRLDFASHVVARLADAGFSASSHIGEGEPCGEILAMAASWPSDVIVVGSHDRHGVDRVLLGSISDRVCRHASCSVLIARERTIPHNVKNFALERIEPTA
jgi:nucleotide-binding universal stress UspA family protein